MDDMYELQIPMSENLENLSLPDPSLLNLYRLSERRIIYIDYEIGIDILQVQQQIVLYNLDDKDIPVEKRVPIKILLDCPGGLLSETMSLIATFQMSKTPIITINLAACYSGGAMLLMAGHKRYAMPFSKAMIHSGSGEFGGTYEQVIEQIKKYEREISAMRNFVMEHTKISPEVFSQNMSKDWYMDDKEQVEYGLVDDVVSNLLDIL